MLLSGKRGLSVVLRGSATMRGRSTSSCLHGSLGGFSVYTQQLLRQKGSAVLPGDGRIGRCALLFSYLSPPCSSSRWLHAECERSNRVRTLAPGVRCFVIFNIILRLFDIISLCRRRQARGIDMDAKVCSRFTRDSDCIAFDNMFLLFLFVLQVTWNNLAACEDIRMLIQKMNKLI
jgi:hypothetical protein